MFRGVPFTPKSTGRGPAISSLHRLSLTRAASSPDRARHAWRDAGCLGRRRAHRRKHKPSVGFLSSCASTAWTLSERKRMPKRTARPRPGGGASDWCSLEPNNYPCPFFANLRFCRKNILQIVASSCAFDGNAVHWSRFARVNRGASARRQRDKRAGGSPNGSHPTGPSPPKAKHRPCLPRRAFCLAGIQRAMRYVPTPR